MNIGVNDFLSLGLKVDAVCYLGDSTEGTVLEHLEAMADMQVRLLSKVDAPIYYIMGNHEFDYLRHSKADNLFRFPMRERIMRESQWHTTEKISDWSVTLDLGDLALVLLSDRCPEKDPKWCTTHCYVQTYEEIIHDFKADAEAVRKQIAAFDKPVITMSHYSFTGGNRDYEGELQRMLMPLPENVFAHFYGHSHIGDHAWGKQYCYRQISTINDSSVTQVDVASLEDLRGSFIRSSIVEWYGGRSFGVFFRNHTKKVWEKTLIEAEQIARDGDL